MLYKKHNMANQPTYTIQVSVDSYISDLEKFNFKKHYDAVALHVSKNEKNAYFSSCAVFNRYKQDVITYSVNMYKDPKLAQVNKEKRDLYLWCNNAYKHLDDTISKDLVASYYYTEGLSYLYGFNNPIDFDKALLNFKQADLENSKPYIKETINIIEKNERLNPNLKDEYLIIYIDNDLKKIRIN